MISLGRVIIFFLISLCVSVSITYAYTLNYDDMSKYNNIIVNKYFQKLMDLESSNPDKFRKLQYRIADYINDIIHKNTKLSVRLNNLSIAFNIANFHNVEYNPNLFGTTYLDLDKEFQWNMDKLNGDLSSIFTGAIGRKLFLYYMNIVDKYPNSISCNNKIKLYSISYLYFLFKGFSFKTDYSTFQNILLCYLKNNKARYQYSYKLATYSPLYRKHNIKVGLKFISGWIDPNKTLDIAKRLLEQDKNKNNYVSGYVLVQSGDKIEEKKQYGGGLCGVSTLVYQTVIHIKDFQIIRRYPHSIWYTVLYGPYLGQDATIFWDKNNKPIKTLLIKNVSKSPIYIKGDTYKDGKKFITKLSIYKLSPIQKKEVKFLGRKGNCGYNKIGGKLVVSCYREVK